MHHPNCAPKIPKFWPCFQLSDHVIPVGLHTLFPNMIPSNKFRWSLLEIYNYNLIWDRNFWTFCVKGTKVALIFFQCSRKINSNKYPGTIKVIYISCEKSFALYRKVLTIDIGTRYIAEARGHQGDRFKTRRPTFRTETIKVLLITAIRIWKCSSDGIQKVADCLPN